MSADLTSNELTARYQLLCNATQVDPAKDSQTQQIETHLHALNHLLEHDLRALARRGSPDDFADIFFALQQELERFHEFCSFPTLSQKVVVAFGGSFSAGKSSLINALLGKRLLVTEVDPTTSLPTYLLQAEQDAIHALNLFGNRITLSDEEFLSLTHDEVERYSSNISRLLRSAFITRSDFPWPNLALIDTPGYSKHEGPTQSARTDEHIARIQLNAAQAIVWVIDARQGCITEDDLKFLASLQSDIPRLIVVSRADQKLADEINSIVAGIKSTLAERGLSFVDVIAASARKKPEWPIDPILEQLALWSQNTGSLRFAHNFKQQFSRYTQYFDEQQRQAQRHLNRLNRILVMADSPDVQADAAELKQSAENELSIAKQQAAELHDLRHSFFSDLKAIGDLVGIALPEPAEIDLADTEGVDLLKLLIQQREQQGRSVPDEPEALRDLMKTGDTSKISSLIGNGIENLLNPHFAANLDRHSRETYARLLAGLLIAGGAVSESQSQAFKALLNTMKLDDIRINLFTQAKNLDQNELLECHRILKEHGLAKHCLLDALILCRLSKPLEESQICLFTNMADYMEITQKETGSIASFAGYILGLHDRTDYRYRDIPNYSVWDKFIYKTLKEKDIKNDIDGGYFILKKGIIIKKPFLLKNSVILFKGGHSIRFENITSKPEERIAHLVIQNSIFFSGGIYIYGVPSSYISDCLFIGEIPKESNRHYSSAISINHSGKKPELLKNIDEKAWECIRNLSSAPSENSIHILSNDYFETTGYQSIAVSNSFALIENSQFSNCGSQSYSSAVSNDTYVNDLEGRQPMASLRVQGCTFDKCIGENGKAIIGHAVVKDCHFIECEDGHDDVLKDYLTRAKENLESMKNILKELEINKKQMGINKKGIFGGLFD